jgi:hypothetical protein
VFTARYALSPYIKQIRFVFKGLYCSLMYCCLTFQSHTTMYITHVKENRTLNVENPVRYRMQLLLVARWWFIFGAKISHQCNVCNAASCVCLRSWISIHLWFNTATATYYIKLIKLFVSKTPKSEPLFVGSLALQISVVFGNAWESAVGFVTWQDW